jgi:hypothetical protein
MTPWLLKKWRTGAVRPLVFRINGGVRRMSPEFTRGGVWQRGRDRMLAPSPAGSRPPFAESR